MKSKHANSTSWGPGQSGNPNGRPPKEVCLTNLMKEFLWGTDPETKKERRQVVIEKVYEKAMADGDQAMMKMLWSYIEGMPQGKLDLTSKGESLVPQDLEDQIEKVLQKYGSRKETSGEKGIG